MIKALAIANAAVTVLLIFALLFMWSRHHDVSNDTPEVVRTKRLEIVDRSGKVRAVAGTEENASANPKIILYDEAAREAAILTLNSKGLGTLYFQSKETEGKVAVGYLWGSDTVPTSESDPLGSWGIRVLGPNGQQNGFGLTIGGRPLGRSN
jgi:hypothetical protein